MQTKFKPVLRISNRLDFFCWNLEVRSGWNMEVRSGGRFIRGVKKKGLELEFSKLEFHTFLFLFLFFKSTSDDNYRDKGAQNHRLGLGLYLRTLIGPRRSK